MFFLIISSVFGAKIQIRFIGAFAFSSLVGSYLAFFSTIGSIPMVFKPKQMGLIEDFSELPLKWILIICVVLKIGLIVCLCGTDLCTSGEPTEHYKNQAETENNQQQV